MKRLWLLAFLLALFTVAGCDCDCDIKSCDTPSEYKQFCLENWWTYSQVSAPDEEYWECIFPSWVGCRDDIMMTDLCSFVPDTSDIDTEEERLAGCEENIQWWIIDFENWELTTIDWEDEQEGGASFVRNWVAHYTNDWGNWKMALECVADFVDWSLSVSYEEAEQE